MDETRSKSDRSSLAHPMLLYPLMALGLVGIAFRIVDERDLGEGLYFCGAVSIGWFLYRNPRILHGPAFGRTQDFRKAVDLEFLWLALALMFAGLVVF